MATRRVPTGHGPVSARPSRARRPPRCGELRVLRVSRSRIRHRTPCLNRRSHSGGLAIPAGGEGRAHPLGRAAAVWRHLEAAFASWYSDTAYAGGRVASRADGGAAGACLLGFRSRTGGEDADPVRIGSDLRVSASEAHDSEAGYAFQPCLRRCHCRSHHREPADRAGVDLRGATCGRWSGPSPVRPECPRALPGADGVRCGGSLGPVLRDRAQAARCALP